MNPDPVVFYPVTRLMEWIYSDSTFTSKVTLDALINSVTKTGEGNNLDVLLIGEDGGKILLKWVDKRFSTIARF